MRKKMHNYSVGVRFDLAATTSTRGIDLAAFPFDEDEMQHHSFYKVLG